MTGCMHFRFVGTLKISNLDIEIFRKIHRVREFQDEVDQFHNGGSRRIIHADLNSSAFPSAGSNSPWAR